MFDSCRGDTPDSTGQFALMISANRSATQSESAHRTRWMPSPSSVLLTVLI
jgi:hypothetical protein